jgi:flagellar biosynthesis/type III secretory pathway protein FliH
MARIIRAGPVRPGTAAEPEGQPAAEPEARPSAQALLDGAAEEARAIVAAAHQDADRIRAEAGLEAAAEAARARGEAEAERQRLLEEAGPALLRLALAAAARVVEREVADDAVAVAVATRALGLVGLRRNLVLRAHPADAEGLRAALPRLRTAVARGGRLAVREDLAVGRGGVVLESEGGQVDGRTETRLAAVARAVVGEGFP